MIVNILIALWFAFIMVLAYVALTNVTQGNRVFPFQNYDKTDIPYITIDIQGHSLNMLVDTGAGVSIISNEVLGYLSYTNSQRRVSVSAITDDSIPAEMVTIPFSIGKKQFSEDFIVYDKQNIANFQVLYGITIHGLLGNEFLESTGCQINYKKHSITLS